MFRTRKSRAKITGKPTPRSHCKSCESKAQVKRAKEKMEKDPEFKSQCIERIKNWGKENKERRLKADADRRRDRYSTDLDYKAKRLSEVASKRSRKRLAQPNWLNQKELTRIEKIYKKSVELSEKTGAPHDVDHIIPLIGENVCGLHVPWNLEVSTASENRSKGNKIIRSISSVFKFDSM